MSADLILMLIILLFVLYSYTTTRNQFAATASALRQIWSGGCPLACQQSEYGAISGLSSNSGSQTAECRTMPLQEHHTPSPSRGCSCDNCPCALIENFIRSCRPATTMYTQFVDCTSTCVDYFIQLVSGMYEIVGRVLNCQLECQPRQTQITHECEEISAAQDFNDKSRKYAARNGKINKVDKDDERNTVIEADDFKPHVETPTSDKGKSDWKESKSGASPVSKEKKHRTDLDIVLGESDENEEKEPTSSSESKGVCAKCIEKDRNCVKHCPKANKK